MSEPEPARIALRLINSSGKRFHSRFQGAFMLTRLLLCVLVTAAAMTPRFSFAAETFELTLRTQHWDVTADGGYRPKRHSESWPASKTALIVCDVWDAHHCLNAVKRLNEFAPRLNDVVQEARRRGATIIHAPSDCMDAYADHPGRKRALAAPTAASLPGDITSWCSSIPAEEKAEYPIDQSDGGEDDDPAEHAAWADELAAQGRNPKMPWKQQLATIEIDAEHDFITDRGDEVWNILEARGIEHVILTGVHVNMCVLGRPFGLRQLTRHGKHAVLMRDMTDSMYNPARWPFVSHAEGTRRVIDHIERHVCPTITSDQLLGGEAFEFSTSTSASKNTADVADRVAAWTTISLPSSTPVPSPAWYRCTLFLPSDWQNDSVLHASPHVQAAWLNGTPLPEKQRASFTLPPAAIIANDVNLLVIKLASETSGTAQTTLQLRHGQTRLSLAGRWQQLTGDVAEPWTMPLPAKFGGSPDILFRPSDAP
jgi:nicotinamidase-related amidase